METVGEAWMHSAMLPVAPHCVGVEGCTNSLLVVYVAPCVQVLRQNPNLLLNVEEADIKADPTYGELTTAG